MAPVCGTRAAISHCHLRPWGKSSTDLLCHKADKSNRFISPIRFVYSFFIAKYPEPSEEVKQFVRIVFERRIGDGSMTCLDDHKPTWLQRLSNPMHTPRLDEVEQRDEIPLVLTEIEIEVGGVNGFDIHGAGFGQAIRYVQTSLGYIESRDIPTLAGEKDRIPSLPHGGVEGHSRRTPLHRFNQEPVGLSVERWRRVVDAII